MIKCGLRERVTGKALDCAGKRQFHDCRHLNLPTRSRGANRCATNFNSNLR
jgi:hypothetical protein